MTPPYNEEDRRKKQSFLPRVEDRREQPNAITLIERSFESYEVMITKYEKLLTETVELTTLIKEKIYKLSTLEQMNVIIGNVDTSVGNKLESYEKQSKEKIESANEAAENSKKSLDATILKLTFRLNLVIGVLIAIFTIGGIAFTYIKYVLDAQHNKSAPIANPIKQDHIHSDNGVLYWTDANGVKHLIQFNQQPPIPAVVAPK